MLNKPRYFITRVSQGITLIELMLITMVFAVLISIIARIYLTYMENPRYDKTQRDILTIENAMIFYKIDNGFYPTNEQGISALLVKPVTEPIPKHWTPYLKSMPLDKQGKPYRYANPGKHHDIDVE